MGDHVPGRRREGSEVTDHHLTSELQPRLPVRVAGAGPSGAEAR